MVFTLIVALLLALVSVIFALQNAVVVQVAFFAFKMKQPFAVFILASLAIGVIIGVLLMVPGAIKNAITISRHRKQIDGLQKSIKEQIPPVVKPQTTPPSMPAPASPVSTVGPVTSTPDEAPEPIEE